MSRSLQNKAKREKQKIKNIINCYLVEVMKQPLHTRIKLAWRIVRGLKK